MNKPQWTAAGIATGVFFALWLGFGIKNEHQKETDRSRSIQGEVTDFSTLLSDAKAHLTPEQGQQLKELESASEKADGLPNKLLALKGLSGFWYKFGNIPVAGGYADSVAVAENTDEAWSVAGGTYYNGLIASKENEVLRTYCAAKAVRAFESAASLAPEKAAHRVNLALVYAEQPPPGQPMKAVEMLRDLEKKYPSEPAVYNALGRLAIKTGQWDRAIQRLQKALELDPKNPNTPCLLAKAYEGTGDSEKARAFAQMCK